MKKLISCIAVLAMITAMTACGNDDGSVSKAQAEKTTSAVTETKAAETTAKVSETKAAETKAITTKVETKKETEQVTEAEESSNVSQDIDESVLTDSAVELMDNMARIWRPTSGGVTVDESDTIEIDGRNYSKVIEINGFDSVDALKELIGATCAGDMYDELCSSVDHYFVEQNEKLYTCSLARGFYIFRTEEGVTITDATDEGFTAICNLGDDMYGKGSAHFIMTNDGWRMDSFEFN